MPELADPTALVPLPLHVETRPGTFRFGADAALVAEPAALDSAWLLQSYLLRAGVRGNVHGVPAGEAAAGAVVLRVDDTCSDDAEGYRLVVAPDAVELVGASADGLARAVQTLRQLLPADALREGRRGGTPAMPCCVIEDTPRFRWRGVHLDVARHFMPVPFVLRFIDLAALHRLNVVHLHLTDDQGWRLEVPSWPRLTEVSSWRDETVVGRHGLDTGFDGTPLGGFYTADDVREIVEFARRRRITVVPEVDLPGHVQSVLAAYPELGNTGERVDVRTTWGISDHVLAPTDEALTFARDVLAVVADLFPSPWVHVGGDEVPRTEWRASPAAAERATALGLASVDELQSWFLRAIHADLTARGRRVVGWDEVLDDGGMPADTVVMAWRGVEHGLAGLAAGHDVVMCPKHVTYLDYASSSGEDEPLAPRRTITLEDIAAWEPEPPGSADLPGRILGVQGQLWTEYMPTPRDVEYMAFPRLAALAEAGWTSAKRREAADLLDRMPGHLRRLDALGVNYRPLAGPHPWQRGGTGRRRRL
ncbi:Beta-N-acetylhexosaminidase [Beutenbergia cavernae DSM 12333]|uniref:beta-N-acetylhexosaminidase n=1 Tax=Beutenbergia cavernae (strain ATCC BAA-8 / DSM 12333 / CCUG 43141 / JCM 11478 / NBRC 16432 / NCIMB 13614 / HKI 0122) TaxID=471853 RepID=C5C1T4_BEUC1|nr:beta-N-acetylhexosaminidase [Beutenbergia cavernae]ACQ79552.1 Beta-N-acetylhexosaminidase [Beutenbergia cavernae DSM 12333]